MPLGATGVYKISDNLYRKNYLIAGSGPDSHSIDLGLTGIAAAGIQVPLINWSAPIGTTGHVQISTGALPGGVTGTIWICPQVGVLDLKERGVALPNTAGNTGNGIYYFDSNLAPGLRYSILIEFQMPYNQNAIVH